MNTQVQGCQFDEGNSKAAHYNWNNLYTLGGTAALLIVLTALIEIIITFLPGGYASAETVTDLFALYIAHRNIDQPHAALALIISLIGVAVFYATNRAFSMLDLSNQYAAAT